MYLTKCTKIIFMFLVSTIITSCSQKREFLPKESVYFSIEDTAYNYENRTYPIKLINKPPFKQAVYRDATELLRLIMLINAYYSSLRKSIENTKGYFVISCDDKYIYHGFLKENSDMYNKYNPAKEENQDIHPIVRLKNTSKLYNWAVQELNKGLTISIIGNKEGTYSGKSFED